MRNGFFCKHSFEEPAAHRQLQEQPWFTRTWHNTALSADTANNIANQASWIFPTRFGICVVLTACRPSWELRHHCFIGVILGFATKSTAMVSGTWIVMVTDFADGRNRMT
jgi:hypothetical protein